MFSVPEEILADKWYQKPIYTDEDQEEPDTMSQCEHILWYMRVQGGITAKTAMKKYGCYRLAARISDLRQRGYNIETVMREEVKPSGRRVRYAEYYLRGDNYFAYV